MKHIIYSSKNNLGIESFYLYAEKNGKPDNFTASSSPEIIRDSLSKISKADIKLVLIESELPKFCIERLRRNNEQLTVSDKLEDILKLKD